MMKIRATRHLSGLTILTSEVPQMASVSLGLWVGTGGRYEPAGQNGVAHFLEHMVFKGTKKRSSLEISQAVEGIGGYLNAFTSEEHTCFYSKALHDRLADLLDVLTDLILHPRLAVEDVELEREVVKEEAAFCFDDPQQHVQELINETLWPNHPLGRPLTGTVKTLNRMRREHLVAFHRQNYMAANVVVAAAGCLRHADVVQAVNRRARYFQAGPRPEFVPLESRQVRPRVRLFTKDVAQTQLALSLRTCPRQDPRRFALRLLNTILGENMSSRLFQKLREDRGLAYHIQSSVSFFHDAGTLDIAAGLDAEHVPEALRIIFAELRRLADLPPSRGELTRARDYLLGQMALSLENTENQMTLLGEQWLGFGKLIPVEEVRRCLGAVTAREVQAVARDFVRPDRVNLAAVSALKSAQRLERLIDACLLGGR